MHFFSIPLFILTGLFSGILAGLFGIGGGVILVPIFWILFPYLGITEEVTKISVATSLAVITVTTFFTSGNHILKGNVKLEEFKKYGFFGALGVLLGVILSTFLSEEILKKLFSLFLLVIGIRQFRGGQGEKSVSVIKERFLLPLTFFLSAFLSSLFGIGGGVVVNSLLFAFSKRKVTEVVALASSVSFLNAFMGTFGYLFVPSEVGYEMLVGYVYFPALFFVSIGALLGSKIGLSLLHRVPSGRLKKWFSLVLIGVALKNLI